MAALLHAYFLHTRPYRETSLLVEVFSAEAGRLSGSWRGGRRSKGGAAQLFQPVLLEATGSGELKAVQRVEVAGMALALAGTALFSGFYLNEILLRLLPREEPQPALFVAYAGVLGELAEGGAPEPLLRRFEAQLLDALGYGLDYGHDSDTGEAVDSSARYDFQPGRGFLRSGAASAIDGAALLRLAGGDFADPAAAAAAKRVHRLALGRLLGPKPLKSRELFLAAQDLK